MLMVTELAEAMEEHRNGHQLGETYFRSDGKPEGFGIELADLAIRLFDTAEEYGLDLQSLIDTKLNYNRKRPFRHGGKVL